MKFPQLIPATFIKRDNRFVAGVRLATGDFSTAFVPTTGRLTGALRPGCRIWLEPSTDPKRKTPFTLLLTALEGGGLCSVNATTANWLFYESLQKKGLDAFPYDEIEKEVPYGRSRLDFRLGWGEEICWVEVKSVTYAEDGVGKFPDAPTSRGRRHLDELGKLVVRGKRASAVFVVQREDAALFRPFEAIDPAFASTLRQAFQDGVDVHAYRCDVSIKRIEIAEEIPVDLGL